jgi:hypothetical protein
MEALKAWVATAAMVALSGAAQAALVDRGDGIIYDTTRNIMWLADMNYAFTSGHTGSGVSADGKMTWAAANAWANNLVYGGYSDWRLPTLNPSDITCEDSFDFGGGFPIQYFGFGCIGGELSGLFITDLGNKARESVLNQVGDTAEQIANLALFSNVRSDFYWSGTEFQPTPATRAWYFVSYEGGQYFGAGKDWAAYAIAVRDVDLTTSVPEPKTLGVVLLALGAVVVARRRRTR